MSKWGKDQPADSGQVNGFLAKECTFEGKLNFDGVMQINGEFRGEILSTGTLLVGPDATVSANIQVGTLIVDGSFEGRVEAKTRVELHASGRIVGDVVTASFLIDEGGFFNGSCQMNDSDRQATLRVANDEQQAVM